MEEKEIKYQKGRKIISINNIKDVTAQFSETRKEKKKLEINGRSTSIVVKSRQQQIRDNFMRNNTKLEKQMKENTVKQVVHEYVNEEVQYMRASQSSQNLTDQIAILSDYNPNHDVLSGKQNNKKIDYQKNKNHHTITDKYNRRIGTIKGNSKNIYRQLNTIQIENQQIDFEILSQNYELDKKLKVNYKKQKRQLKKGMIETENISQQRNDFQLNNERVKEFKIPLVINTGQTILNSNYKSKNLTHLEDELGPKFNYANSSPRTSYIAKKGLLQVVDNSIEEKTALFDQINIMTQIGAQISSNRQHQSNQANTFLNDDENMYRQNHLNFQDSEKDQNLIQNIIISTESFRQSQLPQQNQTLKNSNFKYNLSFESSNEEMSLKQKQKQKWLDNLLTNNKYKSVVNSKINKKKTKLTDLNTSKMSSDEKNHNVKDSFGRIMSETTFTSNATSNLTKNAKIQDKLYQVQNKLTKNQSAAQNKLTLEQMRLEKKKFAEITIQKSYVHGQRLQSDFIKEIELKQKIENQIQNLHMNDFLRYLNRDTQGNVDHSIKNKNQEQKSNRLKFASTAIQQPTSETAVQVLSSNRQRSSVINETIKTNKKIEKDQQSKSQCGKQTDKITLNRHLFRREFIQNSVIKDQIYTLKPIEQKIDNQQFQVLGGISNYDFALTQKLMHQKSARRKINSTLSSIIFQEHGSEIHEKSQQNGNPIQSVTPQIDIEKKKDQEYSNDQFFKRNFKRMKQKIQVESIDNQQIQDYDQQKKIQKSESLQYKAQNKTRNSLQTLKDSNKLNVNISQSNMDLNDEINDFQNINYRVDSFKQQSQDCTNIFSRNTSPENGLRSRSSLSFTKPKLQKIDGQSNKGFQTVKIYENNNKDSQQNLNNQISETQQQKAQKNGKTKQMNDGNKMSVQSEFNNFLYNQVFNNLKLNSKLQWIDNQSKQVKGANNELYDAINELNDLENENLFFDKNLIESDPKQELFGVNQKLKIANQICQRILAANDEFPEIHLNKSQGIELTPMMCNLSFRVNIKNLPSPIRASIQYLKPQRQQSNLSIYISTIEKSPNSKNCELKFFQDENFTISASKIGQTNSLKMTQSQDTNKLFKNQNKPTGEISFKDSHIFICFNSDRNCSFVVILNSTNSRQDANKLKLQQHKLEQQRKLKEIDQIFNENDPYFQDMLIMVREQKKILLIQQNKSKLYYEQLKNPEFLKQTQKFDDHKFLILENNARKMYFDIEERKRKLFMLVKWKYLRQIKEEKFDYFFEKFRNIKYATDFIKVVKAKQLFLIVRDFLWAFKLKRYRENQMRKIQKFYKFKYIKMIQPTRGKTINKRIQKMSMNTLTFLGRFINEKYQKDVSQMVGKILLDWCKIQIFSRKCENYIKGIWFIIQSLENKFIYTKTRMLAFKDELWLKKKEDIIIILASKNVSAAQKSLLQKMRKTQEKIKDLIIQVFFRKQKLISTVNFMKWQAKRKELENQHSDDYDDQSEKPQEKEFNKKILEFEDIIKIIETYLNAGVDVQLLSKKKSKSKDKKKSQEKMKQKQNIDLPSPEIKNLANKFMKKQKKKPLIQVPNFSIFQYKDPQTIEKLIIKASIAKEDDLLKLLD